MGRLEKDPRSSRGPVSGRKVNADLHSAPHDFARLPTIFINLCYFVLQNNPIMILY